jgi:hypothetical protein
VIAIREEIFVLKKISISCMHACTRRECPCEKIDTRTGTLSIRHDSVLHDTTRYGRYTAAARSPVVF